MDGWIVDRWMFLRNSAKCFVHQIKTYVLNQPLILNLLTSLLQLLPLLDCVDVNSVRRRDDHIPLGFNGRQKKERRTNWMLGEEIKKKQIRNSILTGKIIFISKFLPLFL